MKVYSALMVASLLIPANLEKKAFNHCVEAGGNPTECACWMDEVEKRKKLFSSMSKEENLDIALQCVEDAL